MLHLIKIFVNDFQKSFFCKFEKNVEYCIIKDIQKFIWKE